MLDSEIKIHNSIFKDVDIHNLKFMLVEESSLVISNSSIENINGTFIVTHHSEIFIEDCLFMNSSDH